MHDIDLLRRLTETQLRAVIEMDPLARFNNDPIEKVLEYLEALGIDAETMSALLLSWAKQMEAHGMLGIAKIYFRTVDERTGSCEQKRFAFEHGLSDVLDRCKDATWQNYLFAGIEAYRQGNKKNALRCFKEAHGQIVTNICRSEDKAQLREARKNDRVMLRKIAALLKDALCDADFELVNMCLQVLGRHLTLPEQRTYRFCTVVLFTEGKINGFQIDCAVDVLTEYGSESEKRAFVNALARRGDRQRYEQLIAQWNIPITTRHLRLLLANVWYAQDDRIDTDAGKRLTLVKALKNLNARYGGLLPRALASARRQHLYFGSIEKAHAVAEEMGEPLTLDELQQWYRNDGKHMGHNGNWKQAPFVLAKIVELVKPKSNPEPENRTDTYVGSAENPL